MRTFAVSSVVVKPWESKVVHTLTILEANSEAEAKGIAFTRIEEDYKPEDGYERPQFLVAEIKQEKNDK